MLLMSLKRFKLKFSLSSFLFCRPKRPSSIATCPSPATYLFCPFNPKALEIAYPKLPPPPPTTPNHALFKRQFTKVTALTTTTTAAKPKMFNSPVSIDSEDYHLQWHSKKSKNQKKMKTDDRICVSTSTYEDHSGWFSNEEEESQSLVSMTSRSCSFDSSNYPLDAIYEEALYLKNGGGGGGKKTKNVEEEERECKKYSGSLVLRRLMMAEGVMKESVAVLKRSEEPYEDFKMSMLEMILEKQMFDAKELEQLLQCFLSLNSRHHHADIVAAFIEVWGLLFP